MISDKSKHILQQSKNLLAFSAGIDSTALFFILHEHNIEFDIAIVDYNLRAQSKDEVAYAKELATRYDKICYTKNIYLDSSNFEANARASRYEFFSEIISANGYDTLITAHQLNDKLEWFLMQLTKGAGMVELIGLKEIEQRENYTILKPLLEVSKDELQEYLDTKSIKYYIDSSNSDTKYRRNLFRKEYANKLIKEYKNGIKNSFRYIQNDINSLDDIEILYQEKELYILQNHHDKNLLIKKIDKVVKLLGYLASKSQKDEILKNKESVIGGKIAVSFADDMVYIAPYITVVMDKKQKERLRINKIPPKIRGYIVSYSIDIDKISNNEVM
jgi:tRNA(Ile)-lysidine synthase